MNIRPLLATAVLLFPVAVFAQFHTQTSGTPQSLNSVDFFSASEGWAVGAAGTVLHTNDSGTHWTQVSIGATQSLNAVAMDYYDPLAVNIAGVGGKFYATRDGITWYSSTLAGSPTLNAVDFPTSDIGYATGNSGALYRTIDSGHTWTRLITPSGANFYGLYFYDEFTGWVLGANGTALYTENAGTTWEVVNLGVTADLRALSYGDDSTAWIVGNRVILKSTDSAYSFRATTVPYDLRDIAALSATNAFAVGTGGNIYVTTDGSAWQLAPSVTSSDLTSIVAPEADDLFVVGSQGTILSTVTTGTRDVKSSSGGALARSVAWPNPASESVSIAAPAGYSTATATIRLFDALGRELATFAASETTQLSVAALPNGVYPYLFSQSGRTVAAGRITVRH
jgi:photosystem II stability/assembly factor-like uncharacterized protein